jgi:hypothetical protein
VDNFPDPASYGGFLIFGTGKNLFVTKGYKVFPLPLEGLKDAHLEQYRARLESFFTFALREGFNIQIRRTFDSDYSKELGIYAGQGFGRYEWSDLVRSKVLEAYKEGIASGLMRREYLEIYVGKWIEASKPIKGRKVLEQYLKGLKGVYENLESSFRTVLDGAQLEPMAGGDYYEAYFKTFNPSFASKFRQEIGQGQFIDGLTMLQNTFTGDIVEVGDGLTGLKVDGKHIAVLSLNRWPNPTLPGVTRPLTQLPFNEYTITCNIYPADLEVEARKAADLKAKLSRGKPTMEERLSIEALDKKERSLRSGVLQPLYSSLTFIIWADTDDELRVRMDILKTAIRSMGQSDYYTENHPIAARRAFELCMPGWQGERAFRRLYAESDYMADIAPISASINGFLDAGQVLLDNENGGIFGYAAFQGNTPLHTFITGASRAGKSVTCIAMMSQLIGMLGYTVIVESGNSWGTFVKALGGQSVVVKADGSMTFNYLDTDGLPLSPGHLDFCVNVCLGMSRTVEAEKAGERKGLLEKALKGLYRDRFNAWRNQNPEKYDSLRRLYAAIKRFGHEVEDYGSFSDLFALWKEMAQTDSARKTKLLLSVKEEEIVDLEKGPVTGNELAGFACVYYTRTEYPTHGNFVEILASGAGANEREGEEYQIMANALAAWTRSGSYGVLLDGPNTMDMSADVIQFELGEIPESSTDLKKMVGFILTNKIRAEVVKRPRDQKKAFIYEEASIILGLPGGPELFLESLAQMAKYSCQVTIVTQQLAQFMQNEQVAKIAIGNCRQFVILRNSIDDLNALAKQIGLPDVMAYRASLFKPPADLPKGKRFACAVVFNPGSGVTAIVKVYAPPEVLWVADSEGDKYQAKMKALKGSKNIIQTITQHAI